MDKVRIKPARGTGREKLVRPRQAAALVRVGAYVYVEDDPVVQPAQAAPPVPSEPEPTGYAAMSYNDLRALAADRGVEVDGRKKDDYVDALNAADEAPEAEDELEGDEPAEAGRYERRDMRAED